MFYQNAFGLPKHHSYLAVQYSLENASQARTDKPVSGTFKLECAFCPTVICRTMLCIFLQQPHRKVGTSNEVMGLITNSDHLECVGFFFPFGHIITKKMGRFIYFNSFNDSDMERSGQ
jgi:hypothetical protein